MAVTRPHPWRRFINKAVEREIQRRKIAGVGAPVEVLAHVVVGDQKVLVAANAGNPLGPPPGGDWELIAEVYNYTPGFKHTGLRLWQEKASQQ